MIKRKIYNAINNELADESIYERINNGKEYLGGIILTNQEIIYSKGLKKLYMPIEQIVWAYRQIEESHMSLGCCGGVLEEFRVIMMADNGSKAMVKSERESIAIAVINHISSMSKDIAIGYNDENKKRFET